MEETDDEDDETEAEILTKPLPSSAADALPKLEVAKLLLDEWKWRHQHCWSSLRRMSLAAVAIAVVPHLTYVREQYNPLLGLGVLLFPLTAYLVALGGIWLFAEEAMRCRPLSFKYHQLLGTYGSKGIAPKEKWYKSIGMITVGLSGPAAAGLSIGNGWILLKTTLIKVPNGFNYFLYDAVHKRFWFGAFLVFLTSVIFGWFYVRRMQEAQEQEKQVMEALPQPNDMFTTDETVHSGESVKQHNY